MEINEEDVIKFYELQSRYDPIATNIAIVGNKARYKNYVKRYLEDYKGKVLMNIDKGITRIFINDVEYSLIHIRNTIDLRGYKFRKFI